MKRSLEMPVTDECTDGQMDVQVYGRDRIYRTPVGYAGGPEKLYMDRV